jgi:hypothetical protein
MRVSIRAEPLGGFADILKGVTDYPPVAIDKDLYKPAIGFSALDERSCWVVHGENSLLLNGHNLTQVKKNNVPAQQTFVCVLPVSSTCAGT